MRGRRSVLLLEVVTSPCLPRLIPGGCSRLAVVSGLSSTATDWNSRKVWIKGLFRKKGLHQ